MPARRALLALALLALALVAALVAACGSGKPPAHTGAASATVAATAAATPQPTPPPSPPSTPPLAQYRVQAGDTLGAIAARFKISVSTLQQANGLSGDAIHSGQALQIPAAATTTPAPEALTPPADTSPAKLIPIGATGRTDTNAVALTFDAGADAGYTALILDTLKRNGIQATFGMTGLWAQQNPELVKRIAADGHEFMNHTWDHRSWTGLSARPAVTGQQQRWAELDRTESIVHQLTGGTTLPYFRAPFGDQDPSVQADAGLRGYRFDVLWTIDTRGWAGAGPGQITAACARAAAGSIIVMHVGGQSQDGPALQSCIDAIRQNGLGFATVAQLLGGAN